MVDNFAFWVSIATSIVVILIIFKTAVIVPQQSAYIVESLGKYTRTLRAGFHILIPFIERSAYRHSLKEMALDIPEQICITKDNVQVGVDGVLYLQVLDPERASYGITDYVFAITQLAQTTLRSEIGKIDLDRTFEERDLISAKVVEVLDLAGESWGIRVHRYEIKNISPPHTVRNAMEKQVSAERERRAILASSEGDKQSRINRSEGLKRELINRSEGEMQRRINEAEGRAEEIKAIAEATAESIEKIAKVISDHGGSDALKLQLNERYIDTLQGLQQSKIILPANLLEYKGWIGNLGLDEIKSEGASD